MKSSQILKIFIFPALILSSCNVNLNNPSSTPEPSTPSIESEINAPPLESAAEEDSIEASTPSGVCVKYEPNEYLDCFNPDGILILSLHVPGIGNMDQQGLHIAGPLDQDMVSPPVVYHSWEPDQALMQSETGMVKLLRKTNSFLAMSGAEGDKVLAFSDVTFENNIPHSYLYSGSPATLGSTNAFFEMTDADTGMVLVPIAVESTGEKSMRIWYTQTAWELSGADRVFPINRGLYVFDLETNQKSQVLGMDRNFQGLSRDKKQTGSIVFELNGDHAMRVTNTLTDQKVDFPLNPTSDRGAGYAVFSIDGKYAAWLEASGSFIAEPSDFQSRIRVGDIGTGEVVQELDSLTAAPALGLEHISYMRPIGWLNGQELVIEIQTSDPNSSMLIKFNISDGRRQTLCMGSFVGFSYP